MSDLIPNPVALNAGLDLSTAKLLVEPGSMLDCLNYEIVDDLGYRRIDGYTRYDGNISIGDGASNAVYTVTVSTTGISFPSTGTDFFLRDPLTQDIVAWGVFFGTLTPSTGTLTYIPLAGNPNIDLKLEPTGFPGTPLIVITGTPTAAVLTQAQLVSFEDAFRGLVTPLHSTPVGLHWHRDYLFAVVPLVAVNYTGTADNEAITYTTYGTLTADGSVDGVLLDKIVTQEADADDPETGMFIIRPSSTANLAAWAALGEVALTGDISVGSGTVSTVVADGMYVRTGANSDYCSIWVARRPENLATGDYSGSAGWQELSDSFTASVTLSAIQTAFKSLANGNTEAESTYYFESSSGNSVRAVLMDYYIASGAFDTGDAVVRLQLKAPVLDAGAHDLTITTADDMYLESATTTKLGDISTSSTLNYLPGIPSLKENSSRYEFISSNFYATEGRDAVYGVNGAGRAFTFGQDGDYFSFIYTQDDAALDNPRHVENHALHLALGFKSGSVQLSITGNPLNFSGDLGATEIGVGDRVTGLMSLPGSTLGVFCEQSIWSIVGSSVDAFDTQVIAPKTGCVEYTLVSCGEPVFCNNTGIATLSTSAKYGDFSSSKLSKKISSWLIKRLRRGNVHTMNSSGIACAIPVREKNQYRLFFNDGEILTLTMRQESEPAFTFQRYYLEMTDGTETDQRLIPLASTSQVDWQGKERIFVSHYNQDSPITTAQVFALDTGNSFDGAYIPHSFDINWYFGQAPSTYMTLQGLRAFGLSRGLASLNVYATGPQTDFYFQGNTFSTSTVPLNFPRNNPIGIVEDLQPVTNRADLVARGLAIQVRIAGSNTDYTLIEPTHVVQVLTLYTTPAGAFDL